MTRFWHWVANNWGPLGIGTFFGAVCTTAFNLFKWKWPSGADWKRGKQEKKNKDLDARILELLMDLKMPRRSAGMTGAGMPLTGVADIIEYTGIERDAVEDSLARLEARRRVSTDKGVWFPIPD